MVLLLLFFDLPGTCFVDQTAFELVGVLLFLQVVKVLKPKKTSLEPCVTDVVTKDCQVYVGMWYRLCGYCVAAIKGIKPVMKMIVLGTRVRRVPS